MPVATVAPGIHVILLSTANALVLEDSSGPVLVDTGMPKDAARIVSSLKELSYAPQDVQKIIVTHHHVDHTGSLAELKRLTGATAIMHPIDAEAVRRGMSIRSVEPSPGIFSWIMASAMRFTANDIEPAEIEEEVNDGDKLAFAGGVEVMHTPGHSAGHISLYLPRDGGILIVGDVAINVMGLRLPPIVEDMSVELASLKRLSRLQFDTAVIMHGKSITGNASHRFAEKWGQGVGLPLQHTHTSG